MVTRVPYNQSDGMGMKVHRTLTFGGHNRLVEVIQRELIAILSIVSVFSALVWRFWEFSKFRSFLG